MPLLHVAVPVPFLPLLTYDAPEHTAAARGARVLVPLGARQVTGCIVATDVEAPCGVEVKPVIEVLDDRPFLTGEVLDLALWAAEYYAAAPGEAVAAAMPPFAWVESEGRLSISGAGRARLAECATATPDPTLVVLRALASGRSIRPSELRAASDDVGLDAVTRRLLREGLVVRGQALTGKASAFRTVTVVSLSAQGLELASRLAAPPDEQGDGEALAVLGAKQRDTLTVLRGAPHGLPLRDLRARGIGAATLQRLAGRGLVTFRSERSERDPFASRRAMSIRSGSREGELPGQFQLTAEQAEALAQLRGRVTDRRFHVALLHGVTGSGKTELYLRVAAETLASGRTVLVLVPEIALTPAVAAVFRDVFGSRVAIQHSGLSDGERHDQWHRIRDGLVDIVVGTRSAVFSPLDRLGLVIVDEEHDHSYKQEESPRYNGRDLAIVRAREAGALVVLGSATPSMESYRHALDGRYELVTLERRVLDRPLADVRIVNMREVIADEGSDVVLSPALVDALRTRISRGEQALLLLNRRGFSRAVFCRQCGAVLECPNCSISLTVHHPRQGAPRARCHYCNHSTAVPAACTACAAPYLEHVGYGTAQVEAEVRRLFPSARVARVDRDTMGRRGAIQSVLARFARGELDVILGTQMIAKGHDFPAVTLVGVVSADVGLGLPDFRASERTFQLLTQVSGRAGRGELAGEAIVQTLFPEHSSIQLACRQDYRSFYDREIQYRRAMRYPPLVSLINVVVRAPAFGRALDDAADLAAHVRRRAAVGDFAVLGPAPAPLGKLRGEYRAQILLKGTRRVVMRAALTDALASLTDLQRRVTIDVDPMSVM
ncbi:MAG TPA: primosomal protein N' [Vicinamibacterales bacterium]|nr:primosomal protein N' [Vicinamibacterales bacterium]